MPAPCSGIRAGQWRAGSPRAGPGSAVPMETTALTRQSGLGEIELSDLRGVLADEGPFVTLYLDADAHLVDAPARAATRWKDLRRDLEASGAPPAALDALGVLVPLAHTRGQTLGAVANERGVLLEDHHDEPLVHDLGRSGPLPSLGLVIEWRQRRPAHVIVVADLAGADVIGVQRDGARSSGGSGGSGPSGGSGRSGRSGGSGEGTLHEVAGDTEPHDPRLHKVSTGGWSAPRHQRRAENAWKGDAKDVALVVREVAEQVRPRLILLGGDARAVSLIRNDLPPDLAGLVEEVPISRSADGSLEAAGGRETDEIERAIATAVAADTAALLDRLREARAHQLGAIGPEETLAALTAGQVETLLVNDDPDDDRTAWFSLEPLGASTDAQLVRDLGAQPARARLVDVAIALALRTSAGVRIVPAASWLDGGIGALLRFAGATPPG